MNNTPRGFQTRGVLFSRAKRNRNGAALRVETVLRVRQ
jgi:hypothetical protein